MTTPDKIKNIGIFAHVDAGKTTLTEQMLYKCGTIRSLGSVDSGTAQTDWLQIERDRGLSVRCAQVSMPWRNYTVNLIDTPGHIDFSGEAERSLSVLDGVILVISAVEGIQSYTENLWNAIKKAGLPCVIFVNKIDRAGSKFSALCDELSEKLKGRFIPFAAPTGEESRECTVSYPNSLHATLTEAAADFDDGIAQDFLEEKEIPKSKVTTVIARAVADCDIVPVLCGSAICGVGIGMLLDTVTDYLPSADKYQKEGLAALIFKIEHDKTMGKIAHVRMYGGELASRQAVELCSRTDRVIIGAHGDSEKPKEKISQIRRFNGQKYTDVGSISAGDIGALCGLSSARAGDWIGERCGNERFKLANPYFSVKVSPKEPDKLTPLVNALCELAEEDPLLNCKWEKSEREINISITGKIQLEVISALLMERYGLEAYFSPPTVIYKETPARAAYGVEAYTMPKPCWAVVQFLFEPLPRGSGIIYDGGKVPNNQLFYKYQTHIRSSFFKSLDQGLYGWEVTDLKATLVGGEHHTIHTHPLDFFVATPMAVMNGLANATTLLLEPYIRVRISADADLLGRIIGDITQMRGEFDSPVIDRTQMTIEASLPVATSLEYPMKLASMSGGRALFFSEFDGYRECPLELGATTKRRGINPLDRSRWILAARGAMTNDI